jgi:hypothetical protein
MIMVQQASLSRYAPKLTLLGESACLTGRLGGWPSVPAVVVFVELFGFWRPALQAAVGQH